MANRSKGGKMTSGRGGERKGAGASTKPIRRDKAITIRLTKTERDAIANKALKLGKSQTAFIWECVEKHL